jgi:hypothetical protein
MIKDAISGINVGGDGIIPRENPTVLAGHEKPNISVNNENVEIGGDFDPTFFTHAGGHKRKWIILRETGRANESKRPFISLNTYNMWITKNTPVELPVPVINMMKKCIYTEVERDEETGVESVRHIPRFNIEILAGPPSDDSNPIT